MITLRKMAVAARSVPTRWAWAAIAFGSGIVVGAGLMGSLMISRVPTDLDSFGGGYSYVSHRGAGLRDAGIDPMEACQAYVDGYFAYVDGFTDSESFLNGCRAAAARKK